MRVLIINKFLYPKGGSETYIFSLAETLRAHGHQVQFFGLRNAKNIVGNRIDALVSDMEFADGVKKNLTAPLRIIYNRQARREIRRVLDDFQPDALHVNNIEFHLTPSILLEIDQWRRQSGKSCRVVYTAHDYQLVCPSHGMFTPDRRPCEKCLDGRYSHCIRAKCIKGSALKSMLGAADAYYWRRRNVYKAVDAFICCSRFLKDKLDTQPQYSGKTVALHNFVHVPACPDVQKKDYVLYFGRLSPEKGADALLKAAERMPGQAFVFAGSGPSEAKARGIPNVRCVGFQSGAALYRLIAEARLSVCPSECYENCPFSIIESISLGTPVVGARIGGIPELIPPGQTGELFPAGDVDALVRAIQQVGAAEAASGAYSRNCSAADFETAQSYYDRLITLYRAAE